MKQVKPLQRKGIKFTEYQDVPHCYSCQSRNVYYRLRTNDYLCRRCGQKTAKFPKQEKE